MNKSRYIFAIPAVCLLSACQNAAEQAFEPAAPAYEKSVFIEGSDFHGIHGIAVGPDGGIYAGSVIGQSIYRLDPETGAVETIVGAPEGSADDLVFGPDGGIYWTDFLRGNVRRQLPGRESEVIASGLPGFNSLDFHPDGRLFATRVFLADDFYELDPEGVEPPRLIRENLGGLNGFEIGDDGALYGPLWFKGEIVRLHVDTGAYEVLADGIDIPTAVNIDLDGSLLTTELTTGNVYRIDPATKTKTLIATTPSNPDNLEISDAGDVYVTNMSNNGIYKVDTGTGNVTPLIEGRLSMPGGLAIAGDQLYIADAFALRRASLNTGEITDIERVTARHEYPFNIGIVGDKVATSSWFSGTVQLYSTATDESIETLHGFVAPYGLVVASTADELYVAEYGKGCVSLVDLETHEHACVLSDLAGPSGLARGIDGPIYITEHDGGRIVKFDPATQTSEVFIDGLMGPEGIAVDGNRLIVAEVGQQRIIEVALGSRTVTTIDTLPIGLTGIDGLPPAFIPTGVAVQDGKIFVASDLENSIYVLESQ